jgi:para-aminobenzoate synthetase component 1
VSRGSNLSPIWKSSWSDAEYLAAAGSVIEDIENGRYYQLNLLRYWQASTGVKREDWWPYLEYWAGPYGAYLDFDDLGLVSFSPERFFSTLDMGDGRWRIQTYPIKGTRPRYDDPSRDAEAAADLASHPKDRAELNMIVDLMRNDLNRICRPSSVVVSEAGQVKSFRNVHHLVATIEGQLRQHLSIGEILKALCPGGSITGAQSGK